VDYLKQKLADQLGVALPQPGENRNLRIVFEQTWSQSVLFFTILASVVLIVWLYRREGNAPTASKIFLAGIRIALVALAIFMVHEPYLSVQRTGLPYLTVLIDDSASARIEDQYDKPDVKAGLEKLAAAGRTPQKAEQGAAPIAATRLDIAKGLLLKDDARLLRELEKQHRVQLYRLSSSVGRLAKIEQPTDVAKGAELVRGLEASGAQTKLGDGVREVLTSLRGTPPSAMLILTDGQTTEGEPLSKAADLAKRKDVKLYLVGLGSPEPARDIELTELLVDDVVFVDDAVRFQAKLLARGFPGEKVTVRLKELEPGSRDPQKARELESAEVDVPPAGQLGKVELVHHPKTTGERTYILEVDARPRELQKDNNRIERTITVRKEKLKVLYVDTEPRYEFRYLKNYLERDETIDLNVVLVSSDPAYANQDRSAVPTFPASKEDLFAFDVVIFGDADTSFMSHSQMQNMVEFVSLQGGGVLFVAGELFNPLTYRNTPLEDLLPIELADARNPTAVGTSVEAFRPELTLEGRGSPIFRFGDNEPSSLEIWEKLPKLFWYFEAPRKKPAAVVLAEHPTVIGSDGKLPLVLYQFVGSGKAMFHGFDDTWRWRFRVGDKYFGRFWVQTVRFMARSRLLSQRQAEVVTDRKRYQRGQPIQIRVRFPNPALAPKSGDITVQVERKGQGPRKLALKLAPGTKNVFEGALPQAAEGDYDIRFVPPPVLEGSLPTASFKVEAPVNEFERIEMNEPELLRSAEITEGKFYTPLSAGNLINELPKASPVPLETDPPIALWNLWPLLVLFLVLITTEWVFRKRNQMV
jgi:hypothetical protein